MIIKRMKEVTKWLMTKTPELSGPQLYVYICTHAPVISYLLYSIVAIYLTKDRNRPFDQEMFVAQLSLLHILHVQLFLQN